MRRALPLPFLLIFAACAGNTYEDGLGSASYAVSTGANDNGTRLSVTTTLEGIECAEDGSGAAVTVGYTVTSQAAADAAVLTAIVDGGDEFEIGNIASGRAGWTFAGRIKTAEGTVTFDLENGDHTVVICATQDGAGGRLPKRACSEALTVTVDCAPPPVVHCNQGVGNGSEGCDPGDSNHHNGSNDENGGTPGDPGRGGGNN